MTWGKRQNGVAGGAHLPPEGRAPAEAVEGEPSDPVESRCFFERYLWTGAGVRANRSDLDNFAGEYPTRGEKCALRALYGVLGALGKVGTGRF